MILNVMSIFCFTVVAAYQDIFDFFSPDYSEDDVNETIHNRVARKPTKVETLSYTCLDMGDTSRTPFVVLLLYKTSGRFLGMGGIISRRSVLSSGDAVSLVMSTPGDCLCLAGRMGPWWGAGSQIIAADEILVTEKQLALINLKDGFIYNENVAPIRMMEEPVLNYAEEFKIDNAVFGIYRNTFNSPGDYTAKITKYVMKIETLRDGSNGYPECIEHFPDRDFDSTYHECTSANGTFTWGCIGSPCVVIDKNQKPLLIGVISKTSLLNEKDIFHVYTKISPYIVWLKANSQLEYPKVTSL